MVTCSWSANELFIIIIHVYVEQLLYFKDMHNGDAILEC